MQFQGAVSDRAREKRPSGTGDFSLAMDQSNVIANMRPGPEQHGGQDLHRGRLPMRPALGQI